MEFYRIQGGRPLHGAVRLQGAKNSALPILAAAAAVEGTCVLHHCPQLTDIDATVAMLRHIGCRVEQSGETVAVDASAAGGWEIPEHLMREMRSSIIFLGALIARFGRATVTQPGGCDIGLRPIDLHLSALQAMGVHVEESGGQIRCSAPDGVRAAELPLTLPSVGATENILLAALCAKGETVIRNAAREPEIGDLASFLRACGAEIAGDGESTVHIQGGRRLRGAEFTIMPDRIAAATCAAAAPLWRRPSAQKGKRPLRGLRISTVAARALRKRCGASARKSNENRNEVRRWRPKKRGSVLKSEKFCARCL
ncbi:MAG: UDP-N-acetylglucosamine 1-carboxyvinyltransferase [Clostridia bacterium]|nr:UDP-N-acetylglucosamine 1-carboxyvinyltransferase [Clostridia bacterium]